MQFDKITEADRAGKGNVGQADTPNLTTLQMQTLMDSLPNLSIDKFNAFIDQINAAFQTSISHLSTDDQIPTAKAVWDIFDNLDSDITSAVNAWLVAHPEATTTVQDGSLTIDKFAEPVKSEIQSIGNDELETEAQNLHGAVNELNKLSVFVTPEMYGAKGDGVTDDSAALEEASAHGIVIGNKASIYFIGSSCTIKNNIFNCKLKISVLVEHVKIEGDYFAFNDVCVDIENYTVDLGRGYVSLLWQNCDCVKIIGNTFHDMINVMDVIACNNVILTNNQFKHIISTDNPVGVNGYGVLLYRSTNVQIENNIFENVYRHSVYVTVNSDRPNEVNSDIYIIGNIFTAPENADISWLTGYEASIRVRSASRCVIASNKFSEVINPATFTGQTTNGISSTCIDCAFINNTISNISRNSANTKALIDSTHESLSDIIPRITIVDNHVSNCEIPFVCTDGFGVVDLLNNKYISSELEASLPVIYNNLGAANTEIIFTDNVIIASGNQHQLFRIGQSATMKLTLKNNKIVLPFFSFSDVANWVSNAVISGNDVSLSSSDTSYYKLFTLQLFDGSEFLIRTLGSSVDALAQPSGIYWSSNATNLPANASRYGFLIVLNNGTNKKAIYTEYSTNKVFFNTYDNGWLGWTEITPTAV